MTAEKKQTVQNVYNLKAVDEYFCAGWIFDDGGTG